MGDAGSLFIGFVLAAVGIKLRFSENVDVVTWMVPVLVLGLPIFDTTLITLSRTRRRVPFYVGGKDHLSHRLVKFGLTTRGAVLACYVIAAILGLLAIVISQANANQAYTIAIVLAIVALSAFVWLEKKLIV